MIELPPELFAQWLAAAMMEHGTKPRTVASIVAHKAMQWGADQELEACCKYLDEYWGEAALDLRDARRPKPPSLKQEAWKLLETYGTNGVKLTHEQCCTIRRALEALPDD